MDLFLQRVHRSLPDLFTATTYTYIVYFNSLNAMDKFNV